MPAFDFTTGSLPANVTLTRASSGTRLDGSGTLVSETTDVARYTYDGGGVIRGLLNEPSRTNYALRSGDFTNGAWTASQVTITGGTTAPDGTTNATLFANNTVSHGVSNGAYQGIASITTGLRATTSCFFKAKEYNITAVPYCVNGNGASAEIDLSTGLIASGSPYTAGTGVINDYGLINHGSSWYRHWLDATGSWSTDVFYMEPMMADSITGHGTYATTLSNNGDLSTGKGLYMWGAQAELGAGVSSYIPTTSAAVTRAVDVLTINSTGIPNGLYDINIVRESGTTNLIAQAVSGGYVVPTSVSPLRAVNFTPALNFKPQSHGAARHNFLTGQSRPHR